MPAGSAAAPSLAFRDDLNSGLFSPSGDQVAIATGGTQQVVVTSNAVGIFTSSPAAGFLDVAAAFRLTTPTDNIASYQFCDSTGVIIGKFDTTNRRFGLNGTGTSQAQVNETLDVVGTARVVSPSNTATAFYVEDSSTNKVLDVDTLNTRVGVACNTPSATFDVANKFAVDSNGRITEYANAAPVKGDLLAGSAASGFVAVSVGTNGQVLRADSDATGGVSWYSIPAATDYSVVTITTSQAPNTAVTVAGAAAIATSAANARVAGIVTATDTVQVLGIVTCLVEAGRSGQIAQGEPVYLSASEAGKVTDVAPSTATQVVAELGIATAADSSGTVTVLWQPKSITVL